MGYYGEEDYVIHELFAGVPQGSILGPMLFDVAMTAVHRLILQKIGFHYNSEVISYADDIVLIVGLDKNHEISIINHFIRKIELKLAELGLKLNATKIQTLLISRKHDKRDLKSALEWDLLVAGEKIVIMEKIKYLGISLDENQNFKAHVEYIYAEIVKYFNTFSAL